MTNMASNQDLHQRRLAATPRGISVMGNFFIDRAENAEMWDVEGRRYIDFAGGIAVLNTGHRHPKVMAAIRDQLERFTHSCYQVVPYEGYVTLAEKINALTVGSYAKKTALFSTGAEATENVVKIARAATRRSAVIAFSGAFHGRSMMAAALTGKTNPYKLGFGPFPGEIYHAPFPIAIHGVTVQDSLDYIQHLFKSDIEPARVAAIMLEPVQGEGGFYVAPPDLMRGLRAICDEHGILLCVDEVQTGFGRTGKWFAMEHHDVLPDITWMAKSLAGGTTLSAVCGRAEIMDAPAPGGLGGTYAGNPLAVAAAHAVIEVIEEEGLLERSHVLGSKLGRRLDKLAAEVPQIADVRGLGSMVAVEFNHAGTRKPDPDFTKRVQTLALERGLILLTCGVYSNVVRFLYPLTTPDAIFDEALGIIEESMRIASRDAS
ncbi:MAG: 4-aminobutyrate--2-oxoglutarate transaminase [Rhodocyclaceae bacterium]|nr:4-aminobutyrate--2-oxoglutarate transaminase [Rhodocyclaceae bacterium]